MKRVEKRRREAEGGEGREEERQVGHIEGVDTASSVKRMEKRSEEGEEQKEENVKVERDRLVTSGPKGNAGSSHFCKFEGGRKKEEEEGRKGRLVTSRVLTLRAVCR